MTGIVTLAAATMAAEPSARRLEISGIYPHLAAFNSNPSRSKPEPECGIGAVVPWAGKLWYLSYTSHALGKSGDKLYAVSPDMSVEVRPESTGGTHAARMIHRESRQLFIGCYAISAAGKVRAISRNKLPGRLTAVARHLTDPANKVLYLAQEGAVYEVDVHSLAVTELFKKPVPGWHYKGAWTAQGRFTIAANGEYPGAAPFWGDASAKTIQELAAALLQVPDIERAKPRASGQTVWRGVSEDIGSLSEWDGQAWYLIARRQHLDITGPGGLAGATSDDEPVWAMGWDVRSALVRVRENSGTWTVYRLPKASYTADAAHGWYTEWPRLCQVGGGRRWMFLHNGIFDFPADFRPGTTAGLRPLGSTLVTVTDMTQWRGRIVFGQQATSVCGLPAQVPGQPDSNLQFVDRHTPSTWGPRSGFGGVWVRDDVKANTPSEPMLAAGYAERCLHLAHASDEAVTFTLEADARGDGRWHAVKTINVPGHSSVAVVLPSDLAAEWLRVKAHRDCNATACFHFNSPRRAAPDESTIFRGLAGIDAETACEGIVRAGFPTRNLQFLASDGRYYEVDETLAFHPTDAPQAVLQLCDTHQLKTEFAEDAASVIVTRYDGQRFRLPKGDAAFSRAAPSRGLRELIQERYLADFHGTFYEVPRDSGSRPDYQRMKPVASHRKRIADFCTWRGLLVLSGVNTDAGDDGHVFGRVKGPKLWFGAIDDLWKLGKPRGIGGPWKDTAVKANQPSDPYLMTGYDRKSLTLVHDAKQAVEFTIEMDFLADGMWHRYARLSVQPGEPLRYKFPAGYGAHWVRLKASVPCKATATLEYE